MTRYYIKVIKDKLSDTFGFFYQALDHFTVHPDCN